jgi:LAO/AO transport system kinase
MKAGLMEIADVFVVNKADRPGADSLLREIQASQKDGGAGKARHILKCVASEGRGVEELAAIILADRDAGTAKQNRVDPARLREEAKALLRREWERGMSATLAGVKSVRDFAALFR